MSTEPLKTEQPDATQPQRSARRNRALLRKFYEKTHDCKTTRSAVRVYPTDDIYVAVDSAEELIAEDVVVHDPFMGTVRGTAAFLQLQRMFETAFRREYVTLHDINADGDFVSVYYTYYGQHTGRYVGLAATGKPVCLPCMDLYRMHDGKIIEVWRRDISAELLAQLGVVPTQHSMAVTE
jgi:predicted ester cyclase